MSDGYYVKVDSKRVLERLALVRDALSSRPDAAYAAIRDTMTQRVMNRFATKTDPSGVQWANWKPATQYARSFEGGVAYKSGPVSLLEHTGALKASFFAKTVGGVVRAGFTVPYAAAFETGTNRMVDRRILTDGAGQLSQGDRIAIGLAVRRAVISSLDKFLQ